MKEEELKKNIENTENEGSDYPYGEKDILKAELKGRQEQKKEELKFLEALKLWRSWKRMSEFAQANINNRIEELKQKIKGEK